MRFNPPPNWPIEPGWTPPLGWEPPADWEEPPYRWEFWLPDNLVPVDPSAVHAPPNQAPAPSAVTLPEVIVDKIGNAAPAPTGRDREPDARQGLITKAVQNPIWTTLGALVGIVGLVVSMTQIYQAMRTPPVDLQVAALTIDTQQALQGTITGAERATRSIELTPIDLTLQNRGGEPSLITRVEAEVLFFQQLQDCTFAEPTPESISASYHLAIPMNDLEPVKANVANEIRFEVKAGTADRMVLTVGPQSQPAFDTTPMVMTAKLKLIHDDNQTLDVGGVSLVSTVSAANAQIQALSSNPSPRARGCAKENLAHLDKMFAIQATRSRILDALRSAYQRAST